MLLSALIYITSKVVKTKEENAIVEYLDYQSDESSIPFYSTSNGYKYSDTTLTFTLL